MDYLTVGGCLKTLWNLRSKNATELTWEVQEISQGVDRSLP